MTDNTTKELRKKAEGAFSAALNEAIDIIEDADAHDSIPTGDPLVLGTLFGRAGANITAHRDTAVCTITVPDEDGDIEQYEGEAYFDSDSYAKSAYERALYHAVISFLGDRKAVFVDEATKMRDSLSSFMVAKIAMSERLARLRTPGVSISLDFNRDPQLLQLSIYDATDFKSHVSFQLRSCPAVGDEEEELVRLLEQANDGIGNIPAQRIIEREKTYASLGDCKW